MAAKRSTTVPLAIAPPPTAQKFSVSISDPDNPHSLRNLLPPPHDEILDRIPERLLKLTEAEFILAYEPDETDYRLKLRFWDEWQRAITGNPPTIRLDVVYYGVCTKEFFEGCILTSPERLAWMVTPPSDYQTSLQEILYRGLSRLKDIISLPFVTETKVWYKGQPVIDPATGRQAVERKVDRGTVAEVRQIIALLADRVHGAVVQRHQIQAQTQTLHLTPSHTAPDSLETIAAQLAALESKIRPYEQIEAPRHGENEQELIVDAKIDPDIPADDAT